MQLIRNSRFQRQRSFIFGIGILLLMALTALSCQRPALYPFTVSSGQCQGRDTVPVDGEQTLAVVATTGPNITICILRAQDGLLLRHYDLDVHGDVVGQSDGLLYVLERSQQGNGLAICTIHIKDGIKRWCQTRLKDYNFDSLTASNGIAYIRPLDNLVITAVSEHTGQLLWNIHTLGNPDQQLIAVGRNTVYIDASPDLQAGSPTPTTSTTPVTQESGNPGTVCALQSDNGRQRWCKQLAEVNISDMVADESTLYMRTLKDGFGNASIYALNATDGSIRWQASFTPIYGSAITSALFIAHGTIFTRANTQQVDPSSPNTEDEQVYALRASDGKQLWSNSPHTGRIVSVIATDKLLSIVAESGKLSMLNILNGRPSWSNSISPLPTRYPSLSNIIVEQNATYVLININGNLQVLALRASDGAMLWEDKGCASATPTTPVTATSTPTDNGTCLRIHWGNASMQLLQIDN